MMDADWSTFTLAYWTPERGLYSLPAAIERLSSGIARSVTAPRWSIARSTSRTTNSLAHVRDVCCATAHEQLRLLREVSGLRLTRCVFEAHTRASPECGCSCRNLSVLPQKGCRVTLRDLAWEDWVDTGG